MSYWRSQKIEIRESNIHGFGLFANEDIEEGELILVVGGDLMDKKQYADYREQFPSKSTGLSLSGNQLWIVPNSQKEQNSFLNHSCDANAVVDGQIFWRSFRRILAGEEITTDYSTFTDLPDAKPLNCNCQSNDCRKIVTFSDWKQPQVQAKYGRHFSSHILFKISENHTNK